MPKIFTVLRHKLAKQLKQAFTPLLLHIVDNLSTFKFEQDDLLSSNIERLL